MTMLRHGCWTAMIMGALCTCPVQAKAQEMSCRADGTRTLARRWDSVLRVGWELRQDCAHPEWPARLLTVKSGGWNSVVDAAAAQVRPTLVGPLVVRAGDSVRLSLIGAMVHIEMSGVAEQPGRMGDRVTVRVVRQNGDDAVTLEHLTGTVRGAGDVEMER